MNLFESIEENVTKRIIKYNTLNDLVDDKKVAIFYRKEGEVIYIFCYDTKKIISTVNKYPSKNTDSLSNEENPIIFSIFTKINAKYLPENTGEIQYTISQDYVKGSNVVYPFSTAVSGGKIISDRGSVSDEAEWVWKKFFNNKTGIKKFKAIDNIKYPITPEIDDDSVYNQLNILSDNPDLKNDILTTLKIFLEYGGIRNKNKQLILDVLNSEKMDRKEKIKKISDLIDLKKFLNDILEFSPLNFIFKDQSSKINKTNQVLKTLMKRNNDFINSHEFDLHFNNKSQLYLFLYSASERLFIKRNKKEE